MVDWTLLGMEASVDCDRINEGFSARALQLDPERNPSEFRRLFVTYKEALRSAIRQSAINSGRRAEDFDFDFSDERNLPEFLMILDNVISSGLKGSNVVWKALTEDSDYRNLQRTAGFLEAFDKRMSAVNDLPEQIWKYLVNHFTVYGFASQNRELVAHLKSYGNINDAKSEIISENGVMGMAATMARPFEKTGGITESFTRHPVTAQPSNTSQQTYTEQQVEALQQTYAVQSPLLQQYLKLQNEGIVSRYSQEFFTKLDRVYSHYVTKNNLSAWRYLFQNERYLMLVKQVHFTELLARRMKNVDDIYPVIWEYIIDKTKVPEAHPMYSKTTGLLKELSKSNAFKGQVSPQPIISTERLEDFIERDDYSREHLTFQQENTYKKKTQGNNYVIWWTILIIIMVLWRCFSR